MVNNTGIKMINEVKQLDNINQSFQLDSNQRSLNHSLQDGCYFSEKKDDTNLDGDFFWTKGLNNISAKKPNLLP